MKRGGFSLYGGTYTILFICLAMVAVSLLFVALYMYCPYFYGSDARRWLTLHFAQTFDTVAISLCLTLSGAFLLEYTYRAK